MLQPGADLPPTPVQHAKKISMRSCSTMKTAEGESNHCQNPMQAMPQHNTSNTISCLRSRYAHRAGGLGGTIRTWPVCQVELAYGMLQSSRKHHQTLLQLYKRRHRTEDGINITVESPTSRLKARKQPNSGCRCQPMRTSNKSKSRARINIFFWMYRRSLHEA